MQFAFLLRRSNAVASSQHLAERSLHKSNRQKKINAARRTPPSPDPGQQNSIMQPTLTTICLLTISNVFMTIAWYGHLQGLRHKPWLVAALLSWGIALFEYLIQVPANRIGHQVMNVGQLKILQEVISLTVFVPFAWLYLKEKPSWDYLWAAFCLLGAAFFVFRSRLNGG